MEENKVKYQPWTKEEMALLAHLMGVAFNAGKNQSEAAEFASSKLGRSKFSCLSMYQAKMRNRPLSDWAIEPVEEEVIETPVDLGDTDIDKEPDYKKSFSFVNDLLDKLNQVEAPAPMKIMVHDGDYSQEAEILIDKSDVVVAKVKGLIITIEL